MLEKTLWTKIVCGAAFTLAATLTHAADTSRFVSPLESPAAHTPLATRLPFNAVARAGTRLIAAGQRGTILYSDNAKDWTQAQVPVSSDLTALTFIDAKIGWAVGHEGVILTTADGGASWTRVLDGKTAATLVHDAYSKPAENASEELQRLAGDAEAILAQGADKPFLDVWFEDAKHGFVIGAFNLILATSDGGKTWKPWLDRVENPRGLHLYSIRPVGDTLYIVGEQGLVLKLDRTAQRFKAIPLPYQGTLFGLVATKQSLIVFGLRGNAYRSTDGGANWTKVDTKMASTVSSGIVREDGSIVLAGQSGQLIISNDDGANFTPVKLANPAPTFALAPAGKNGMALVGYGGVRVAEAQ